MFSKKKTECRVCGYRFTPERENIYTAEEPRSVLEKHRGTPAGNQRSADLRTLGRRLRMREEADEGNLVRSFGALDAERNYYQNAGSDRRQRRGGAEQIRTPLREEVFADIQKHYV